LFRKHFLQLLHHFTLRHSHLRTRLHILDCHQSLRCFIGANNGSKPRANSVSILKLLG